MEEEAVAEIRILTCWGAVSVLYQDIFYSVYQYILYTLLVLEP